MTDTTTVFQYFLENCFCFDDLPVHSGAGVYAIFVKTPQCLPNVVIPQKELLYIGKSDNLAGRNHFKEKYTCSSTVRRSLGALLKYELKLDAKSCSAAGSSVNGNKNYRFDDEGETCLSKWMKKNLKCSIYALKRDEQTMETQLIKEFKPPLNLRCWKNPQKEMIEKLRTVCEEEAKIVG